MDLAVLRIDDGDWPIAEVGDSAGLGVGHLVLAVGHGPRASWGVISAVGGAWRTWGGGEVDRLLRVDLVLYPGFSGGPLVDASGKVAGLVTSGLSRQLELAVPASTVTRVVDELLSSGRISRGYVGLGLQPVMLPEALRQLAPGSGAQALIVVSIEADGPAARAGVMLGDVLLSLDGTPVHDPGDVQTILAGRRAGTAVTASLVRAGAGRAGDHARRAPAPTAIDMAVSETPHVLAAVMARLREITVELRATGPARGAGVIWRANGLVVTCAHVVASAHRARAGALVVLPGGRRLPAALVAWDRHLDLAVLRVEARDLPAATVGDPGRLRPGELVLAVGHPFGLPGAVVTGIVHGAPTRGRHDELRWIQADLRLAPGNSGVICVAVLASSPMARARLEAFVAAQPGLRPTAPPLRTTTSADHVLGALAEPDVLLLDPGTRPTETVLVAAQRSEERMPHTSSSPLPLKGAILHDGSPDGRPRPRKAAMRPALP